MIKKCYKLVTIKEGSYYSFFISGYSIKYAIGKKAKSVAGPLFCYYYEGIHSIENMLMLYQQMTEVGKKDMAVLECEYEPYFGKVDRIISPLLPLSKDMVVEFWENGSIASITDKDLYIDPRSDGALSAHICFCKWVKPIQVVALDDVKKRLESLKEVK